MLAATLVQSRLPFVVRALSVVSRLGFFLWRLFRLGLEGCDPVLVPPFFFLGGGGGSPSLIRVVFTWRFQQFGCPSSLSFLTFLDLFAGVLSSRFRCLLIARGGCWIVLGYPLSVAWRQEVLPWFSVRGMSACPSGAAVPLGSSVLRSSWSLRWGHLSQVGPVFFLSPRS